MAHVITSKVVKSFGKTPPSPSHGTPISGNFEKSRKDKEMRGLKEGTAVEEKYDLAQMKRAKK